MMEWIKKNDIFTKMFALIASVFLWYYVVSSNDIDMTQTYSNIPVELSGVENLTENGLVIVSGGQSLVSFKISGKTERLAMVSSNESLSVTADIGFISAPGEYKINYRVNSTVSDITITKITTSITIEVDRQVSKSVPVDLKFSGSMQEGLVTDNYHVRPDAIKVSGPEKLLDTIVSAKVEYDISSVKQDTETTLEYFFVDSQGNIVESSLISVDTPSVILSFGVLMTDEIPVTLSLTDFGAITGDMVDVTMEPEKISISGSPDVVVSFNRLDLGSLSLETVFKNETFELEMPIILPNGIISDQEHDNVKVTITPKGIKKAQIEISEDQLPESSSFTYVSGLSITAWMDEETEADVSDFDISLVYNEDSLQQGRNEIPVQITPLADDIIIIGDYSVTVEVP